MAKYKNIKSQIPWTVATENPFIINNTVKTLKRRA